MCVRCEICGVFFLCIHNAHRVYVQDGSMRAVNTPVCHMTHGRVDGSHGDVLNVHTGASRADCLSAHLSRSLISDVSLFHLRCLSLSSFVSLFSCLSLFHFFSFSLFFLCSSLSSQMSLAVLHWTNRCNASSSRNPANELSVMSLACDLPSFLAARSRVRSCSHKLSAKSMSTSGWARQKSRQPLSFPRLSRAWWTNLNRCRKSVMQLGHVEVSPIFRERVHRRPCFLLACWSLAISQMKCSPHSLHVHGLTTGWLLTRDYSPFLSNMLSTKCKLPTRVRHFLSFSAALSQLFSHPSSSGDGRDCLAVGDKARNAFMSARSC